MRLQVFRLPQCRQANLCQHDPTIAEERCILENGDVFRRLWSVVQIGHGGETECSSLSREPSVDTPWSHQLPHLTL